MRIVIVQGAFFPVPPILGGAVEKMWFLLGKEFVSAGHRVTHISRRYSELKNEEVILGVQHIRIKGYNSPRSLLYLKWLDLLYTLRALPHISPADIIVTNTFWAPLIFPFLTRADIYVDVGRMPKGQMRLYARARRLRANSKAVAEAILHEWSNAGSKVRVIPNPLPFIPQKEIKMDCKENTVLYAGRVHKEKGLSLLLQAWSQLPQDLTKKWKLQIVGPWEVDMGGSGKEFLTHLHSLSAGKNVDFTGFVQDTSALNQLYEKASIFVYPSLAEKGETFGLAALEAMSWGCVPIVSSLSCFTDFIHPASNGLIFDHRAPNASDLLSYQLTDLMKDKTKREKLGLRASRVRLTHHISNIAQQFLKDFESL